MKNILTIVSVIVCTYNRSILLKNCLESLDKQVTVKSKYEIIVIDNNSIDDTRKVVRDFTNNRTNIRIVTEKNIGRSHARNRGWKESAGKYIAYIDDDAIAKSDWVEQIIAFVKKYPEINVFGGPYDRYSYKPIPAWIPKKYFTLDNGNKIKFLNLNTEWISGSNIIFNRSIFNKYGGFNLNFGGKGDKIIYGEETELLLRLKKRGEIVYYVPNIRVRHLVAEHKLHLWWLLKNDYIHGYSFSLIKKPKFNLIRGIMSFILSLFIFPIYLINIKKGVIKRRVYYALSNIFSSLGQIMSSFYYIKVKILNHYL